MRRRHLSQSLLRPFVVSLLIIAGGSSLLSLGPARTSAQGQDPGATAHATDARDTLFTFQRTYPFNSIPLDARHKAWDSRPKDWIQTSEAGAAAASAGWRSIGPTPTTAIPATVGNESGRIEAIAISPANPQLILIGGSVGGIWRSTDGGINFMPVADDQVDMAVGGIAFAKSNPSVVYAGMGNQYERYLGGGVLKSTDAGLTWSRVNNNSLPIGQTAKIEVDPTNPDRVYLAQAIMLQPNGFLATGGFYFSTDGGINWTNTLSGDANAFLLHPSRPQELYVCLWYTYEAGRQPGLYKSTDGGRTWSLILGSPYPPNILRVIQPAISAASPDRVYAVVNGYTPAGSWDIRTMVSVDGGQTWTNNGVTGPLFGGILLLAADPVNANVVYTGGAELWKSTDGGVSYTTLTPGLYTPGTYTVHVDMHSFAFSPTNHNEFCVGTDGGLWKGTSGGTAFQNLNATLSLTMFYGIAVHPTDPYLVFGGTQDNGIQRRRSISLVWEQLRGGDFGQPVVNPLNPSMIFNTEGALYIDRWLNNGDIIDKTIGPVAPDARGSSIFSPFVGNGTDATLYLGTWRLWLSTDLGETWSKPAGEFDLTKGNSDVLRAIGVSRSNPNVVYTGSAQGRAMVSTNRGTNWTDITIGLPDRYISSITVDPTNPAVAFLTVSGYRSGHIFKTTNMGTMWTDISGNLPDIPTNAFLIDPLNPSTIYAGTDIGVFLSPSGGNTWFTLNSGMPPAVVTGFGAQSNGLIRLATYGRGMYELVTTATPTIPTLISPSSGATGISVSPTLSWNVSAGANTYRLQVSTSSAFATTSFDDSTITGTSKQVGPLSTNTTYLWRVSATNTVGTSPFSSPRNFTTIVSAPATPTLASPTNGATNQQLNLTLQWNAVPTANSYRIQVAANQNFLPTLVDDSTLTASSKSIGPLSLNTTYYWRIAAKNSDGTSSFSSAFNFKTIVTTFIETLNNEIPAEFSLSQNYPNPFNPATTISFNLPSKSFVSLKVFDALGREASILLAEELTAGTYVRRWNAAELPNGVYFYRLQAGSFTETKKLVLLR